MESFLASRSTVDIVPGNELLVLIEFAGYQFTSLAHEAGETELRVIISSISLS